MPLPKSPCDTCGATTGQECMDCTKIDGQSSNKDLTVERLIAITVNDPRISEKFPVLTHLIKSLAGRLQCALDAMEQDKLNPVTDTYAFQTQHIYQLCMDPPKVKLR